MDYFSFIAVFNFGRHCLDEKPPTHGGLMETHPPTPFVLSVRERLLVVPLNNEVIK